jgi:hypothetical protein
MRKYELRRGVRGVWPVAELLQRSDPARCVFGHAGRLVIEPSIPIRLAAGEHEEDSAQELVCQGDDGLFVSPADDETLVVGAKHAFRSSGGVGCFAEQIADEGIALAGLAALAFSSRFMVARTQRRPRGEPVSLATRVRSSLISMRIIAAAIASMPGIVCSSSQAQA